MKLRLRGNRDGRPHCPLCRVVFVGEPETYECPGCHTRYHPDCADELGGCSTLGCPRVGAGPGDPDPADTRLRARVGRWREVRRHRRAEGPRLQQEHVQQAQAQAQSQGLDVGAALVLEGGCMALECLSAMAVLLLAVGLTVLGLATAP